MARDEREAVRASGIFVYVYVHASLVLSFPLFSSDEERPEYKKQQSTLITIDNAWKQILSKQYNPIAHLHHLYFFKVNWTAPKYNFMLQSQIIRHDSPR